METGNTSKEDRDDLRFFKEASNTLEALCNLNYLICEEADHPDKVRQFARFAEERLGNMAALLESQRR
jgi:hypothetical protein